MSMKIKQLQANSHPDLAGGFRSMLYFNDVVIARNVRSLGGGLLTPYEYANLIGEVGRIWTTADELKAETKYQLPGHPEIIVLSHDGLLGANKLPKHSDASHHPARPWPLRALLPVILPEDGSATTTFYSTANLLNPDELDQYRDIVAWHQPAYGTGWPGRWNSLIQIDPWSGRRWIAYDQVFIKEFARIGQHGVPIKLDDGEERSLRDLLNARLDEAPSYTHDWQLGDLLIWNNRGTVHSRTATTPGLTRKMYRITFDMVW